MPMSSGSRAFSRAYPGPPRWWRSTSSTANRQAMSGLSVQSSRRVGNP